MRQQQGGGGGGDNSLDFLWTMVFVIAILLAIWYFGKSHILHAVITIRYYELLVLNAAAHLFHLTDLSKNTQAWLQYFHSGQVGYTVEVASRISEFTGSALRFVVCPVLVLLAVRAYMGNVASKFNTAYQMTTLRAAELKDWPHVEVVAKLNLTEVQLDEMPWAMAMTPMQFAKKHELVEEYTKENEPAVRLLRGKAYQAFVKQLGPLWTTIDQQPLYIQALFAVFAAKAYRDSKVANALLRAIAASSGGKQLRFPGARALLRKHYNKELIGRVLGAHAYTSTVMAGMLNLARTDGVVACAEFLWLKKVDRRLWYTLNDVGRQTATPEVAGIFAHFQTESRLRAALRAPYVDTAVDALEVALDDIKYDPEINQ